MEPMDSVAEREGDFLKDEIALSLDLRSYRLTAIKKAAYRFADRFTAILAPPAQDRVSVALRFRSGTSDAAAREIVRQFFQELLDQELRELVAAETNAIRTLILAQAFSNLDLVEHDK
jgi:His-Xaa-Ser system protein HxsD